MNFVKQLIEAGFIEQGQKRLLEIMPNKKNHIPKWWDDYPYDRHWFGLCIDHPDSYFRKDNKIVYLSLQGISMPTPPKEYDELLKSRSCRYICFKNGKEIIYETFSGEVPDEKTVDYFLTCG